MDRKKMNGFKLYSPIDYKVDELKRVFASILCDEKRSMNFHNAMFMVDHSSNLFRGLFKKNESIDRLVAAINYNFNCIVNKLELIKCRTLGDVIHLIKEEKRKEKEKEDRRRKCLKQSIIQHSCNNSKY